MSVGTLYIVATPIGNLEDITARAVRVLREVDWIAAEDTRHTRKLLTHLEIHTRVISCHGHNERASTAGLLQLLQRGESVALVSDAGTPAIADPGLQVAQAAREASIPVVPIPGPCAAITALSAAGLPTHAFTFVGFLPEKMGRRRTYLEQLTAIPHTLVFYVAKWDVARYLQEMLACFGDRPAALARELTKQYETIRCATLAELLSAAQAAPPRGEIVVLVAGAPEHKR
ncbi:MAG: 16S rRNA (cytidine(1402)-2'-O)-methyltransferase [Deltaproteobacteria bacterium]|nr:16S rRNA (cytidine(1402)-2'-O)-methyltransferase [Deltaproteobacteria bacterium]